MNDDGNYCHIKHLCEETKYENLKTKFTITNRTQFGVIQIAQNLTTQ